MCPEVFMSLHVRTRSIRSSRCLHVACRAPQSPVSGAACTACKIRSSVSWPGRSEHQIFCRLALVRIIRDLGRELPPSCRPSPCFVIACFFHFSRRSNVSPLEALVASRHDESISSVQMRWRLHVCPLQLQNCSATHCGQSLWVLVFPPSP